MKDKTEAEFPLTFRSRNMENYYRFDGDGSYQIIVTGKAVKSFSFGKFHDNDDLKNYMIAVFRRHDEIPVSEFSKRAKEIFSNGYEKFLDNVSSLEEDNIQYSGGPYNVEDGEMKSIAFIDDNEDNSQSNAQQSEVDRILNEIKEYEKDNY